MRGRGIGTARGRATIMRGLSFFYLHFCAFPTILMDRIASFLLLPMSLANGAERNHNTVCSYYKLIVAMLTSSTWTRGSTSSTGNQALILGSCSIIDDPSSNKDILYHLPLKKIIKKNGASPNYLIFLVYCFLSHYSCIIS